MADVISALAFLMIVLLAIMLCGGAPLLAAMFVLWSEHRQKMARIRAGKDLT